MVALVEGERIILRLAIALRSPATGSATGNPPFKDSETALRDSFDIPCSAADLATAIAVRNCDSVSGGISSILAGGERKLVVESPAFFDRWGRCVATSSNSVQRASACSLSPCSSRIFPHSYRMADCSRMPT